VFTQYPAQVEAALHAVSLLAAQAPALAHDVFVAPELLDRSAR